MSHVEFKKHQLGPVTKSPCRMSNSKNGCVAVSILGVKGHNTNSIYSSVPSLLCGKVCDNHYSGDGEELYRSLGEQLSGN